MWSGIQHRVLPSQSPCWNSCQNVETVPELMKGLGSNYVTSVGVGSTIMSQGSQTECEAHLRDRQTSSVLDLVHLFLQAQSESFHDGSILLSGSCDGTVNGWYLRRFLIVHRGVTELSFPLSVHRSSSWRRWQRPRSTFKPVTSSSWC